MRWRIATVAVSFLGLALASQEEGGRPRAAVETFDVRAEESEIVIDVGRAGIFQMFGHDHEIRARSFQGTVEWHAEDPSRSRFRLEIDATSLYVADEDVSEEDRAAIQADMESKALALEEHDAILFESTRVEAEPAGEAGDGAENRHRLTVRGSLSLRGVSREIAVPFEASVSSDRFRAVGELELPSNEWGVPQIAVAGGTVKTEEDLAIAFQLVAVKE